MTSKPTGKRVTFKQSTLPSALPQPAVEQPAEPQDFQEPKKTSLKDVKAYEDTFRERLSKVTGDTLEALEKALREQLFATDPATGERYNHDIWLDFPTAWVRMHYEQRATLYVPDETLHAQLGENRATLVYRHAGNVYFEHDGWRVGGERSLGFPFVGATCLEKAAFTTRETAEAESSADFAAQRPRGIKQPGEPTLTERLEHELTHLPFRPWCEICVKSKSRQAKSRKLSLKQPVLQMDYSFLSDSPGGDQATLLNVVDVLTGMALSVVVPSKGRTPYSQAELRRFVLEVGRTFGVLQTDPEPALKSLAEAVTGEVGGLSLRSTPTGWKQAHGSVGNLQATLYGQIKAFLLEISTRYGVEVSVTDTLFPWLVRHAQWLVNRYLQNAEGTTAFERRWGRKYNGLLCRFGEAVHFRKRNQHKGQVAWFSGIWLGRDTESDQHFVADADGVYKTRSVKRFPPSRQTDLELFLGSCGSQKGDR